MNGTIFDVKRFAVHDGGGLRTTLFLKGCPLSCPWCQNPEGMDSRPLVWRLPARCVGCGSCRTACPEQAIGQDLTIDYDRCTGCGQCAAACPAGALEVVGRTVTAQEAAQLLLRDRVFYSRGGGITLSGGEVLLQWQFAKEVLAICHQAGIHTAIETSLFGPQAVLEALLPVVDQFIIDIKLFDPAAHRAIIGVDNALILSNYRFLVQQGADVLVRTPLIPGYTDSEENIRAITAFLAATDPDATYELLNFNPLCRSKYQTLGQDYPVTGAPLTEETISRLYSIVEQAGLRIHKE